MLKLSSFQLIILTLLVLILPVIPTKISLAQGGCTGLGNCITDTWSFAVGWLGLSSITVADFINNIIAFLWVTVASLATLFILLGGILYILSAGDEQKSSHAKKMIFYAIIGLFIALISATIKAAVEKVARAPSAASAAAAAAPFTRYIKNIGSFLYALGLPLAIAAITFGGVMYIVSTGNDKRTSIAKNIILFSLIGLLIILAGTIIAAIVIDLYTGNVIRPSNWVNQQLTRLGTFGASITALAATVAVLFGGIMYILSTGDEQRASQAKKIIMFALIGLVIAAQAQVITGLVQDVYGDPAGPGRGATPLTNFIGQLGIYILFPLALIATAAIIYGGYMYITSAGEEDKARRGKQIILYAFFGVVIILLSASIVNIVISL